MKELDRKLILSEGCAIKEAHLDDREMLAEFEFNNQKFYVEGEKSHTKLYNIEEVRIYEKNAYDVIGYGQYKYQNRPWYQFTYSNALRKAVISWLGEQASEKIDSAIETSSSCQEALDKFAKSWNEVKESINEEDLPDAQPEEPIVVSNEVEQTDETPKEIIDDGIAATINDLIVDEFEAIQKYNDAISSLSLISKEEELEHEDIISILNDIVNEESMHVGQLQELLKVVSKPAEKIEDGKEEAEEVLVQSEAPEEEVDADKIKED